MNYSSGRTGSCRQPLATLELEGRSSARACSAGITHDLRVLRSLADELAVMRGKGKIVESGP